MDRIRPERSRDQRRALDDRGAVPGPFGGGLAGCIYGFDGRWSPPEHSDARHEIRFGVGRTTAGATGFAPARGRVGGTWLAIGKRAVCKPWARDPVATAGGCVAGA